MADNDDTKQDKKDESDQSLLNDVAITAEFEYQEDWESLRDLSSSAEEVEAEEVSDAADPPSDNKPDNDRKESSSSGAEAPKKGKIRGKKKRKKKGKDSISQALDDFDSYLDEDSRGGEANSADFVDDADSKDMPAPDLANGNRSDPGAWGYDQPQVSGVFSRYEEETSAEDEDFDLFEEDSAKGKEPESKTLQELTSEHEKKIRRLNRQLDYQKQVLQVMAELLVEARVISRPELKRRLKALRRKNS